MAVEFGRQIGGWRVGDELFTTWVWYFDIRNKFINLDDTF